MTTREIIRDLKKWNIDDPERRIDRHGLAVIQLTLLALADSDPTKARSPSGVFMARLHQIVANPPPHSPAFHSPPPQGISKTRAKILAFKAEVDRGTG